MFVAMFLPGSVFSLWVQLVVRLEFWKRSSSWTTETDLKLNFGSISKFVSIPSENHNAMVPVLLGCLRGFLVQG